MLAARFRPIGGSRAEFAAFEAGVRSCRGQRRASQSWRPSGRLTVTLRSFTRPLESE